MEWLVGQKIRVVDPFSARLCVVSGVVENVSAEGIALKHATINSNPASSQVKAIDENSNVKVTISNRMLSKYIIEHL